MKHILVHLHVYYHDQIDYFIQKLKNINGVEWDLVVTFSQKDATTERKLKEFKPDVRFLQVENFGYDVWPFIKLIKETDLTAYDYVIKLHTKRWIERCRPNIILLEGYDWRNALVDGILYNESHFKRVLNKFESNPEVGMISSLLTNVSRDYYHEEVKEELKRLDMKKKDKFICMGTMFMMRSKVLQPLKSELISESLFRDEHPRSGTYFQTAHLYERVLSHLPINTGFKKVTVSPLKRDYYKIKLNKFFEPLGKFFFSCEREGFNRDKVVRIFMIKIYQKSDGRQSEY